MRPMASNTSIHISVMEQTSAWPIGPPPRVQLSRGVPSFGAIGTWVESVIQ